MMLDSSQLSTKRLNQSMTATKYRKPPRIGMSVICMRQANPIYTVGGVGECSDGVDEQAQVVSVRRRRSRGEAEQAVAEYEASALSRADFCRQRGLSLATLARYRKRQPINNVIDAISTYVGHAKGSDTYWYVTATPELMAVAAQRFSQFAEGGTR